MEKQIKYEWVIMYINRDNGWKLDVKCSNDVIKEIIHSQMVEEALANKQLYIERNNLVTTVFSPVIPSKEVVGVITNLLLTDDSLTIEYDELCDFTIKNIAMFGTMYTNKEGKPRFNLFKFVAI